MTSKFTKTILFMFIPLKTLYSTSVLGERVILSLCKCLGYPRHYSGVRSLCSESEELSYFVSSEPRNESTYNNYAKSKFNQSHVAQLNSNNAIHTHL